MHLQAKKKHGDKTAMREPIISSSLREFEGYTLACSLDKRQNFVILSEPYFSNFAAAI